MAFFAPLLALAACGSPLLQPGIYDVEITYTEDYMLPAGYKSDAQWDITEDGGSYEFTVVDGGSTLFKGEERGSEIIFHFEKYDDDALGDCEESNIIDIVLDPNADGDAFEGNGYQVLTLCARGNRNDNTCEACVELVTATDLKGTKE
jgi:hypothetical protein